MPRIFSGVLLSCFAALCGVVTAADRDPELIRRENAREGARDWQLTRVALVDRTSVRAAYIEGYCSQQSVRSRRVARHHGLDESAVEVSDRDLSHGLLRRPRRPADDDARPVRRQHAARSGHRREEPARVPLEAGDDADDSRRLAERRLSRPAHVPAAGRDDRAVAELRRLHRQGRSAGRHSVPVLRQHLAGLQPLAEQLLGLHASQGQPGAVGRRQLRSPVRPLRPVHRRRQRSALGRLGRVPAVRVSAELLGWSSTATT